VKSFGAFNAVQQSFNNICKAYIIEAFFSIFAKDAYIKPDISPSASYPLFATPEHFTVFPYKRDFLYSYLLFVLILK
jgi:hypothetical protein